MMAALSLFLPLYLPASKADPGLLIVVCLPTLIFASGFLGLFDAFFDGGKEVIGPFKRVVTLFLALALPVLFDRPRHSLFPLRFRKRGLREFPTGHLHGRRLPGPPICHRRPLGLWGLQPPEGLEGSEFPFLFPEGGNATGRFPWPRPSMGPSPPSMPIPKSIYSPSWTGKKSNRTDPPVPTSPPSMPP